MIGASPVESLISLLFSPVLSLIIFAFYKFGDELIRAILDIIKNIKFAYTNILSRQYFNTKLNKKDSFGLKILLHIYSGLFIASCGVFISVYYYALCDGRLSILGPLIMLLMAIFLDKKVGKYRIFYMALLIGVRVIIFTPLLVIKLFCNLINKICKLNSNYK